MFGWLDALSALPLVVGCKEQTAWRQEHPWPFPCRTIMIMKNSVKPNRAVALKYRQAKDRAPRVVASGKGGVAKKIIELAREHGIYIHDDPDLVEVLSQLDLNEEIPPDLYIVVSELLAFVYALNKKTDKA